MKHYCICPKETFVRHHQLLNTGDGGHFIEINADGDEILAAVNFQSEEAEHSWYTLPGVEPLPHPHYQANHKLHPKHVERLKHALPGLQQGHTVLHVAHHAGKAHPLMKLNRFLHPQDDSIL